MKKHRRHPNCTCPTPRDDAIVVAILLGIWLVLNILMWLNILPLNQ
jgi:hypothetical protein